MRDRHPLVKFILIILLITTIFIINNKWLGLIPFFTLGTLLILEGERKFPLILCSGAVVIIVLSYLNAGSIIIQVIDSFKKILLLVLGSRLFMKTTETTDLVKTMEKTGIPTMITLPLAVTLRFIPTIKEEFFIIQDVMRIRGIKVTLKGFVTNPVKMMEFILVPLLMRSAKISDELSASCITRGISLTRNKTSYKVIRVNRWDIFLSLITIVIFVSILVVDQIINKF